jgi:hypothetical protein
MSIRVNKVADIINGWIQFSRFAKKTVPGEVRIKGVPARTFEDVARSALLELRPRPRSAAEPPAEFHILRRHPPADPHILRRPREPKSDLYSLSGYLSKYISSSSYSEVNPVFLPKDEPTQLIYFRDRLFISERLTWGFERAEVVLRVKKAVYDEEAELSALRAAVANVEAAVEFQKSGPKRNPIPEDVKLLVWARDGGHCVCCGSDQELHFDHIIPVAKGGNNTATNIQILCETCNLKKSDRIGMP